MCLAWDESLVAQATQPAVGTGDWKVALTRTLESVRYAKQIRLWRAALRANNFGRHRGGRDLETMHGG